MNARTFVPKLVIILLMVLLSASPILAQSETLAQSDQVPQDEEQLSALPKFSSVTIDGDVVSFQKLKGKVVLLDFWGTWCAPCKAAIPHLQDLSREFASDPFVLVGVAADTNLGKVRQYTEVHGVTWPQILDHDRSLSGEVFGVPSYPTYILADHEGTIIFRASGFSRRTKKAVTKAIREALQDLERSKG